MNNSIMSLPIMTLTSSSSNTSNLREPSFSSYLNGADQTFVLRLRNTAATTEEEELDVFDAKKYFSDSFSHSSEVPSKSLSPKTKKDGQERNFTAPSVRSESSRGSRSPLLYNATRKKSRFLSSIRCTCSCTDTDSVRIDVCKSGNRKTEKSDERLNPDGHFSFPIFNPKNLENGKNDGFFTVEKKINMWTWDAISQGETKNGSFFVSEIDDYDGESDASSDLFEIESINPRASSYAPSEASVEWSVVTASAAGFSALSESEELKSPPATSPTAPDGWKGGRSSENRKNGPAKEMAKRRSFIPLWCKSEKAVRVAGDAHITYYKGSVTPTARFRDPGNRVHSYDSYVLSEPHRGSADRLLYT